jgi:hypothetical protein
VILTPKGRKWAEEHADESEAARVALVGYGAEPVMRVTAAIEACNHEGADAPEEASA